MSDCISREAAMDAGLDFVDFYCDNPDAPGDELTSHDAKMVSVVGNIHDTTELMEA